MAAAKTAEGHEDRRPCSLQFVSEPPLEFESDFECGNLEKAAMVDRRECALDRRGCADPLHSVPPLPSAELG